MNLMTKVFAGSIAFLATACVVNAGPHDPCRLSPNIRQWFANELRSNAELRAFSIPPQTNPRALANEEANDIVDWQATGGVSGSIAPISGNHFPGYTPDNPLLSYVSRFVTTCSGINGLLQGLDHGKYKDNSTYEESSVTFGQGRSASEYTKLLQLRCIHRGYAGRSYNGRNDIIYITLGDETTTTASFRWSPGQSFSLNSGSVIIFSAGPNRKAVNADFDTLGGAIAESERCPTVKIK